MNRRIKKKRQKLEAICPHKWKYLKRIKKRAHVTRIEVQHGSWGMFPDKDNYTKYLRRKRHCDKNEAKIEKHFLFGEMCIWQQKNAKKVKEGKSNG